ncbi:MAG: epimerase, partial [Calditrichaceae bacterium]
ETLLKHNPHMTFCYVSGAGTDSSENGKVMWARVKGKTENDLLKMAFKSAYMFRPGYIQPTKGLKNAYKIYRYLSPFYPVWKTLFPNYVCTLEEIGLAMISVVKEDTEQKILENKEIRQIAARS